MPYKRKLLTPNRNAYLYAGVEVFVVIISFLCTVVLLLSILGMPIFRNVYADTAENMSKYTQLQSDIEYEIGERRYFKEKYFNNNDHEYILVALGDHCVIWVQYDLWVDEITQDDYSLIQENVDKIYSKMSTEVYNHANSWGDVDDDGKINILLSDLNGGGVKGYYDSANLKSGADSNMLDVLFIDLSPELGLLNLRNNGGKELWADIAHEFQHMLFDIACTQHDALTLGKELWLNESLSAACAYLFSGDGHYIDENHFQFFLLDYSTENGFLFKDFGLTDGKEYLMTTLFGIYLCKQYGEDVIKDLYGKIESNIAADQLLLELFEDKYSDFEDLFSSFMAATVFDGVWSDKYSIYSEDITYNGKSYSGLYELRSENQFLYSFNQNICEMEYSNCRWQEKVFYYDKTYFSGMNRLRFDTNADHMFYCLMRTGSCAVYDSEIKTGNDEVLAVFVNCASNTLSFKTVVRNDKTKTKAIAIVVFAFVAVISFCAIIIVFVRNKKKRDKKK